MSVVHDPALYRKMSEPKENLAAAEAVRTEFYNEVCALREKYGIPDFVISFSINFKNEEGKETTAIQVAHRGDTLRSDRLVLELVKQTRFGDALLNLIEEVLAVSARFKDV